MFILFHLANIPLYFNNKVKTEKGKNRNSLYLNEIILIFKECTLPFSMNQIMPNLHVCSDNFIFRQVNVSQKLNILIRVDISTSRNSDNS